MSSVAAMSAMVVATNNTPTHSSNDTVPDWAVNSLLVLVIIILSIVATMLGTILYDNFKKR